MGSIPSQGSPLHPRRHLQLPVLGLQLRVDSRHCPLARPQPRTSALSLQQVTIQPGSPCTAPAEAFPSPKPAWNLSETRRHSAPSVRTAPLGPGTHLGLQHGDRVLLCCSLVGHELWRCQREPRSPVHGFCGGESASLCAAFGPPNPALGSLFPGSAKGAEKEGRPDPEGRESYGAHPSDSPPALAEAAANPNHRREAKSHTIHSNCRRGWTTTRAERCGPTQSDPVASKSSQRPLCTRLLCSHPRSSSSAQIPTNGQTRRWARSSRQQELRGEDAGWADEDQPPGRWRAG